MTPRLSRLLVSPFVCAVLLCLTLVLPSSFADSRSSCEVLRSWAAEAYAGTQPTIDQLARLDLDHRMAALGAVTPAVRAALWREHLTRFAARPDLSATQRALVHDAFDVVTPALYEGAPAALASARQLEVRVTAAFKGTAYEPAWLDIATFGETASLSGPITSEPPRHCNCSVLTTLGPCPLGKNCVPIECASAAICGFVGSIPCDGRCYF